MAAGCDEADAATAGEPVAIAMACVFGIAYLALAVLCAHTLQRGFWGAQRRKSRALRRMQAGCCGGAAGWALSSNSAQILLCVAVGAITRGSTFIPMPCAAEEGLRAVKDSAFFGGFTIMVLYWVELQRTVARVSSVERLRPWLYAIMVVYVAVRSLQSVANLAIQEPRAVYQVANGVTVALYGGMLVAATLFGCRLRCQMGSMRGGGAAVQAKLSRLTRFIASEVVVMTAFLAVVGIRRFLFGWAEAEDPWLWFWLKVVEKVFEFAAIALVLATVGSLPCQARRAAAARARMRTTSPSIRAPPAQVEMALPASSIAMIGRTKAEQAASAPAAGAPGASASAIASAGPDAKGAKGATLPRTTRAAKLSVFFPAGAAAAAPAELSSVNPMADGGGPGCGPGGREASSGRADAPGLGTDDAASGSVRESEAVAGGGRASAEEPAGVGSSGAGDGADAAAAGAASAPAAASDGASSDGWTDED